MKHRARWFWGILFLIVVFAFAVRMVNINHVPPGVNRDEAAIGYTAYSLLQTGKDEYGVSWPLSFRSFGDWKLPFYIYLTMIPVLILGLSEVSVRVVSVAAGVGTVVFAALVMQQIVEEEKSRYLLGLGAALLVAISPWSIHFSRVGAEANLAVFFVVAGVYFFFASFQTPWKLIVTSLLWAASLFTYHGDHIFTPLLLCAMVFLYIREVAKNRWKWAALGVFGLLALVIYSVTLFGADRTKISGINLLSDISDIHERIDLARVPYASPLVGKLFHNKLVLGIGRFAQNYVESYSPQFLYFQGGGNHAHNIPFFGNAYLIELPFFLWGIVTCVTSKSRARKMLLAWLLIAPLAPSITKDAPHSARMLAVIPALQCVVALGLYEAYRTIRVTFVFVIIALLFATSFFTYMDDYLMQFPRLRSEDWGIGYKKLSDYLIAHAQEYPKAVITRPQDSPYIFFAFYQKIDPRIMQQAVRYPDTTDGFAHVAEMGTFSFRPAQYPLDVATPHKLLIEWSFDVPASVSGYYPIALIPTTLGKPLFSIIAPGPIRYEK